MFKHNNLTIVVFDWAVLFIIIYIYISNTSGWKTLSLLDSVIVKITEWAQAKCRYSEHCVLVEDIPLSLKYVKNKFNIYPVWHNCMFILL